MKLTKPKNIGKKGTILMENLIFIILNLVFLSTLVLFLFLKMGSAAVLEERYAKQIALVIDSAKPGMTIYLNMENAISKAEKENWPVGEIVTIENNVVTVKLREKGGYSYSFFNGVKATPKLTENKKEFYFFIE
ncbi:hypothetical protein J4422_03420 [Candidatus Pacearchaeota archaeon]|nr:hypothetical protein [Candidatus Pacearchaeota archaeon]